MTKIYSNDKDRQFYNKNGYVVFRSVLTEKECDVYIKESHRICKKKLNLNGKIIILSLDPKKNEIPTFNLMKKKLNISLKKDKKMFDLILKNNPKIIIKRFIYQVKISKTKYLKMIDNRYISTLLDFTDNEIIYGSNEVMRKYKKNLKFKDRLICFVIKR